MDGWSGVDGLYSYSNRLGYASVLHKQPEFVLRLPKDPVHPNHMYKKKLSQNSLIFQPRLSPRRLERK